MFFRITTRKKNLSLEETFVNSDHIIYVHVDVRTNDHYLYLKIYLRDGVILEPVMLTKESKAWEIIEKLINW